ncbi:MAG TPA: hydantoinase/oxoprolinase family protein [Feifaniaceae bacterium]|nr:hydantoinase/oxoprolinase family protein [Feifaniaceae bacterium]
MANRMVRMGIDVGGTHTKAVALDNATNTIIGKATVKTTHDHADGVARGVVMAFQQCMQENDIDPKDVVFVAHSTTQATNALVEGDVAHVGIIGVAGGGLEGFLAKKQSKMDDIPLGNGKLIHTSNAFLKKKELREQTVRAAIEGLTREGVQVIVSTMAFGVDDTACEQQIYETAKEMGLLSTMASEITKLYGLTRRTRTATINASILPKMLHTADSTERSVRESGIEVPLMIMRGDGGVMEINEVKKRPVLTMLSGPAASVMGSLMYLRASNGVYFEVGGTTTNIGVIKNGRPGIDYSIVGGHRTFINSLDVRVLGVAGGSMVRLNKQGVVDVGPRSAHIAGLDYAVFTEEELVVEPRLELFAPKQGDPADYACVRLKNGERLAITNSCAANVLGLVGEQDFSHANREAARRAMQPLAEYAGITVEQLAGQILQKSYEKIQPVIEEFAVKYRLEHDQISLVGVGGGAAALIGYCANKMQLKYSIPENAEVISSIGVALAMVRDVVERVIPNPTPDDIRAIRKEATEKAIQSGAVPDSVEVHIEIDQTTSKVTAIALGSNEVKAANTMSECTSEEAKAIAAADMGAASEAVQTLAHTNGVYVFGFRTPQGTMSIRILDKKGFIKVQLADGAAQEIAAQDYRSAVKDFWETLATFSSDGVLRPDYYICVGAKVMDYAGSSNLEHILMIMDMDLQSCDPGDRVVIVGARNKL